MRQDPQASAGVHAGGYGSGPTVMGILNVTPDSFSDGGDFLDTETAVSRAERMLDEGAHIVDIGGESTRPGSDPVSEEEELRRVVHVVRGLVASHSEAVISVDTYCAAVAEAALEAGAAIINDVTALRGDPDLAKVVADAGCQVVLMHMLGEPKTMQQDPRYEDVVREVSAFLSDRAEYAIAKGVSADNIILDAGIGFGKTMEHNLALLQHLDAIVELGFPVLVGASRKTFIGRITGVEEARYRVFGTVAANVMAYERGASIFRVHDVLPNREALAVAEAISNAG